MKYKIGSTYKCIHNSGFSQLVKIGDMVKVAKIEGNVIWLNYFNHDINKYIDGWIYTSLFEQCFKKYTTLSKKIKVLKKLKT
jgi:hypothetical protein